MPEVFFEALNKKSKGFIAGPIKTGAGYHLLELTDKRGPLVLYEDQWKVRHILMSPTKLRDALFTQQELEEVRRRFINGEPRNRHIGLDIAAEEGTPLFSPLEGKVILIGNFFYKGNVVYVDHGNGLVSSFSHLSAIDVKEGQMVSSQE